MTTCVVPPMTPEMRARLEDYARRRKAGHVYVIRRKADGCLLYVGMSCDPWLRIKSHRGSPWFVKAGPKTIAFYKFARRSDAARMEERLIRELDPRYNIHGFGIGKRKARADVVRRRKALDGVGER